MGVSLSGIHCLGSVVRGLDHAKATTPRYGQNKLHSQGARKGPRPPSRCHCSELLNEKDIGRQWELQ
ncbi:hypothetical protein DY000_02014553 [Brassica cretica]|uniref:Uncharacterized protein n=1 Tax=Brassica cretica TaxID=69181 RepID=A0ABQ7D879_BRACR|nr:hypothetical protein DY000_02014553 [Brassica cretica]